MNRRKFIKRASGLIVPATFGIFVPKLKAQAFTWRDPAWVAKIKRSSAGGGGPTAIVDLEMSEGSGTTLADSSGNGNNFTTNAGWLSSSPPGGASAYQTFASASTQQANSNAVVAFGSNTALTIDFYLYRAISWASGGTQVIACGGSRSTHGWEIISNGSNLILLQLRDASNNINLYVVDATLISTSAWHHFKVVFNYNDGSIQFYVDGGSDLATLNTVSGTYPTTPGNLTVYIGELGTFNAQYLDGNLALFKIFPGDTH